MRNELCNAVVMKNKINKIQDLEDPALHDGHKKDFDRARTQRNAFASVSLGESDVNFLCRDARTSRNIRR